MSRFLLFPIVLLAGSVFAQPPVVPSGNWPLDEIVLRSGAKYQGLIVEEQPDGVKFRLVKRPPGRPTVTLTTFFTKEEVRADGLKRISDTDRHLLRERLAELDSQGERERRRMESLELLSVDWLGRKEAARRYDADQFLLVSAAPDEVTRRAAVRLEQIFTAYARVLPPRYPTARPTTIELAGTKEDYLALLKESSVRALNAAVFFPADQRIVCGSDLKRLGDELYRTALHHRQQLATADKTEQELRELYKGQKAELERFLGAVKKERDKVTAAERANDAAFDTATRKLFAILYHEAFHSYVMAFVYPPLKPDEVRAGKGTGELPRWLNEGLAQLFEDPVIEAGELRIGHADADRLKRVQSWLSGKPRAPDAIGLIPLADLLRAGKESFVADQAGEKLSTDRTYLTAWAVAHHLTFARRVIGTKEFDAYLTAVNTGTEPAKAFEALVGQTLAEYEKDWHDYLRRLQPDGTVKK
jgi:hypothetical protein